MTINWYHKILLVLAAFVSMMVYFAVRSVNTPLELVTEKYYEAEINYQDRLNDMKNAQALEYKPVVKAVNKKLLIQFPQSIHVESGKLNLYYAANSAKDLELPLQLNEKKEQVIELNDRQGAYRVQISWTAQGKSYFNETKLFL